jgi:protein gp37
MAHNPDPHIAHANAGLVERQHNGQLDWTGDVRLHERRLTIPLHWQKPRRIFVNSLSDLFAESVPDAWIDQILTVMLLAPQHRFQVLTKRPERMALYLRDRALYRRILDCADRYRLSMPKLGTIAISNPTTHPAPWIWWGVSAEDQATLVQRSWVLRQTPAAVRFLSLEPLLGPVALGYPEQPFWCVNLLQGTRSMPDHDDPAWDTQEPLHWVIVGGESGPAARTTHIAWIREVVRQCAIAGVPCFVKQLGRRPFWDGHGHIGADYLFYTPHILDGVHGYLLDCYRHRAAANPEEWPEDLRVRQWPRERTPQGAAV